MMPNKTCHEKWCQMMRNDAFCLHHFAIDCEGAFKKPPDFLSINEFFSKITPSLFTIKEGSTAFLKPLFSWRRLAALGNLKASFHCAHLHNLSPQGTGDVPTALLGAQTASLYGWRTIRGLASSGAAVCGMRPHGYISLTGCLMLARSLLGACSKLFRKPTWISLTLKRYFFENPPVLPYP